MKRGNEEDILSSKQKFIRSEETKKDSEDLINASIVKSFINKIR